jgi:HAD superfamily hydrolase (TIGR01484 family)
MTPRLPKPIQLLCFDFDGTLVDREHDPGFDPALGRHLREFQAQGGRWAVNTGRSLAHTIEGLVAFQVTPAPDFIIAREHEIYVRNAVGRWVALGDWNARCQEVHGRFYRRHRRFLADIRRFIEQASLGAWIDEPSDPAGVVAHGEAGMQTLIDFVEELRLEWPEVGYHRNTIYLRFTHRDFHKGSALAELARQLGLPPAALFAAGDNYNDLSMLRRRVAHHLACPANALEAVQAQVTAEGGHLTSLAASRGMAQAVGALLGNGNRLA